MRKQCGFTLVETMVVVAIVAILAAVVYPMYNSYMCEARRSDGKVALMEGAQTLERFFTNNNTYAGAVFANTSPKGYYALTAAVANTTSFVLQAQAQGPQLKDELECLTLQVTHLGQFSPENCW